MAEPVSNNIEKRSWLSRGFRTSVAVPKDRDILLMARLRQPLDPETPVMSPSHQTMMYNRVRPLVPAQQHLVNAHRAAYMHGIS